MRAQVTYPAGLENITNARHFAAHWLTTWGCDALVDDAQLLVSELVSNAMRHTSAGVVLTLDLDGDRVRIEVFDQDDTLPPTAPTPTDAPSGHGLLVVDRLAGDWGSRPAPGGKVVWAEVSA